MASDDIKRKLIENTKKLLQEKASITIKDIADASFVNIAAVNYHFGSKESLMRIVLNEILENLKEYVTQELIHAKSQKTFEEKLEMMINYMYNFALENVGLLNYLFLSNELQKESSSLLIDQFFADNQFTRVVYQSLAESTSTLNEKELRAKYILLFSSFCIPLFIQISQTKLQGSMRIELFKDPEFRQTYIKSIMKVLS
jgi:AcrR family transcriptional regulator